MQLIALARDKAPELAHGGVHRLYVAAHDYVAQDEDEFDFTLADEMLVHRTDPDGWWLCTRIADGRLPC
jgi:hypothetical protein